MATRGRLFFMAMCCAALTACAQQPAPTSSPTKPAPTSQPATSPTAAATATRAPARPSPASTRAPTVAAASPSPAAPTASTRDPSQFTQQWFDLPSYPHDVAPDPADPRTVWWTAQRTGELGRLDPTTGASKQIPLGRGSAPHGVIVGPDGNAWVTDSGQNAIVKVDAKTERVTVYPLPANAPNANLNTAAFDARGTLWFTGQSGVYGRVNPETGEVKAYSAPRGRGPYGIDATPAGRVFYASLAGSHIAEIDPQTGQATPIDSPTKGQGARRVWSDSAGVVWVSEWNAGQVGRYDPVAKAWKEWKLPGERPMVYAVYVDENDKVWLSEWSSGALVMFDPLTEKFTSFKLSPNANVRQILGRAGEVWAAESGADKLLVVRTR